MKLRQRKRHVRLMIALRKHRRPEWGPRGPRWYVIQRAGAALVCHLLTGLTEINQFYGPNAQRIE
jgi:hypothetical protein